MSSFEGANSEDSVEDLSIIQAKATKVLKKLLSGKVVLVDEINLYLKSLDVQGHVSVTLLGGRGQCLWSGRPGW